MLHFLPSSYQVFMLKEYFGIALVYILSGAMVVLGVYLRYFFMSENPILQKLLSPLRFLGLVLIIVGAVTGLIEYGKSVGARDCEAAWKQKGLEDQISMLKAEAQAHKEIADKASQQAKELSDEKDNLQTELEKQQKETITLAACRKSTNNDDRRLRDIINGTTTRRKPTK